MNEEFKYSKSTKMTVQGIMWLMIALFNIGLYAFTMIELPNVYVVFFLIVGILQLISGIFLLTMYKRTYIEVNSWSLRYHRGFIIPEKELALFDVKYIKTLDSELIIGLKSGKEHKINLTLLSPESISRINEILMNYQEIHGYEMSVKSILTY